MKQSKANQKERTKDRSLSGRREMVENMAITVIVMAMQLQFTRLLSPLQLLPKKYRGIPRNVPLLLRLPIRQAHLVNQRSTQLI